MERTASKTISKVMSEYLADLNSRDGQKLQNFSADKICASGETKRIFLQQWGASLSNLWTNSDCEWVTKKSGAAMAMAWDYLLD